MSQRDRILRALGDAGERGITAVSFAAPNTVDGGPPIMRVAARIHELRGQGVGIVEAGVRDKCLVYKLERVVEAQGTVPYPTGPEESGSVPGPPQLSETPLFPETVGRRPGYRDQAA